MDVFHPNWSKRHQVDAQRLFELSPSAHLVVNAELKVIAVTDKYLQITENQRENLLGRFIDRDFSKNPDQPWIGSVRTLIKSFRRVQQSARRHSFVTREAVWNQDTLGANAPRTWRATNKPVFDRHGNLSLIFHRLREVDDPTKSRIVRGFAKRLISAQETDRKRIAREFHDQMAQYLSAISLELESLKSNDDRPQVERGIEHIQRMIEHVGEDVHRLTWDLRPAPIEELGFRNSLHNCAEEVGSHSTLEVFFHSNFGVSDRFDPVIETVCYRFIQESLANIVKHAEACTVSVIVTQRDCELEIIVEDDGKGFDADQFQRSGTNREHFGLQGMVERVKLVGGQFHIESSPGHGTSLFARVPTRDQP